MKASLGPSDAFWYIGISMPIYARVSEQWLGEFTSRICSTGSISHRLGHFC